MRHKLFLLLVFYCLNISFCLAQFKFYEDRFTGGVTTGGYSPAYNNGGTGYFSVNIPTGSTLRKVFLLGGRQGNAAALTVTLNGISYTFDSSNQITSFQSPTYGGYSGVHAIDITSSFNPAILNCTLVVPSQSWSENRYSDFYLYIAYNKSFLPIVNTAIFLNTYDFGATINYNSINLANPVHICSDIGISLFTGYICNDNMGDGESVSLNSTLLGTIGGHDFNSGECGGPIGSFYYDSCKLYGLGDDNPNQAMVHADALSNVNGLLTNKDTTFTLQFIHQPSAGMSDNAIWAVIVAYGDSCSVCTFVPVITGSDSICPGNFVSLDAGNGYASYLWSTSDTTQSLIINSGGTYSVSVTTANGCSGNVSFNVTQNAGLTPLISGPTSMCPNSSVILDAGNGYASYLWSTSDTTQSIIINSGGTYSVSVTSANGCSGNVSFNVTQNAGLTPLISGPTSICPNSSAILDAGNGYSSYVWSTTDTTQTILIDAIGTYSVTVTDATECSESNNITVTLNPINIPVVSQSHDTLYCSTNLGYTSYQWSVDSVLIAGAIDAFYIATYNGYYSVEISDTNGCHYSQSLNVISIGNNEGINTNQNDNLIYLPNVFSPNGDYSNDVLYVRGENIKELTYSIYDRWGEKVFETQDKKIGWNGKFKIKDCEVGVYVYVVNIIFSNGESLYKKGNVTLVR